MIKATINGVRKITVEENTIDGESRNVELVKIGDQCYSLLLDNRSYTAYLLHFDREEKKLILLINGSEYEVLVEDKTDLLLQRMGINVKASAKYNFFKAPMPGLIRSIMVSEGQAVKKGEVLLILEAMKMENALKSPEDQKVKSIKIQQGQAVEKNQLLFEFE